MAGWHQRFDGHEFEQTLGDSAVREVTESDMTERLNHTLFGTAKGGCLRL